MLKLLSISTFLVTKSKIEKNLSQTDSYIQCLEVERELHNRFEVVRCGGVSVEQGVPVAGKKNYAGGNEKNERALNHLLFAKTDRSYSKKLKLENECDYTSSGKHVYIDKLVGEKLTS